MNDLDDGLIRDLLGRARRIAVVGMSDRDTRPSYRVAAYLREVGYEIVPVNPLLRTAMNLPCASSLLEIDGPVNVVDVFRRPEETDGPIDEAIKIGAGAIWLQLEIQNNLGRDRAEQAGLVFVQDRCIAVEHARLFRRE